MCEGGVVGRRGGYDPPLRRDTPPRVGDRNVNFVNFLTFFVLTRRLQSLLGPQVRFSAPISAPKRPKTSNNRAENRPKSSLPRGNRPRREGGHEVSLYPGRGSSKNMGGPSWGDCPREATSSSDFWLDFLMFLAVLGPKSAWKTLLGAQVSV